MRPLDTSLGGEGRSFPPTTTGVTERFPRDRAGLETLCRRYWKPVYAYLRSAFGKDNEDAKDLTQAFFLRLLEGRALEAFDPARGRFRTYLKVLLRSFVGHHQEAVEALKRGGGATVISLDAAGSLPYDEVVSGARAPSPEEVFDRLWKTELAEHLLARFRERCRSRGLEVRFRLYEAYALVPKTERPTYAALAARFGVTPDDVRNHLFAARAELREEARRELAATTSDDRELEGEWNDLFGTRREG
jgi:RNA polymerase sigma-70 factor (ECF subfamily)